LIAWSVAPNQFHEEQWTLRVDLFVPYQSALLGTGLIIDPFNRHPNLSRLYSGAFFTSRVALQALISPRSRDQLSI